MCFCFVFSREEAKQMFVKFCVCLASVITLNISAWQILNLTEMPKCYTKPDLETFKKNNKLALLRTLKTTFKSRKEKDKNLIRFLICHCLLKSYNRIQSIWERLFFFQIISLPNLEKFSIWSLHAGYNIDLLCASL